jgi:hypothetical protein
VAIETLGEAYSYGWRVTARCAHGKRDGMKSIKECVYRAELDMETLVWTRGRSFPPLAPGNVAAMPDVRLARRATDLHRAARSADDSWRKVGAEVKVTLGGTGAQRTH